MSALSSLKILDFSTLLPGPFGTLMLADLGANVLRVEAPDRVELTRLMGAKDGDSTYLHRYINRSKKSLALNLKKPEAIEIIKRLIMEYDIVVEQFRPGVMDKLGLGYDVLKAVNPKLIYCSLTGYGQTGPYRDRAGHDNNYLSIAGVQDHSRRKGQAPVPAGIQIADLAGGSLHLVVGLLAAVIQRADTGKGQYVDISMTDAAFTLNSIAASNCLGAGVSTGPEQEMLNGGEFYDYYETSDGRYFSVGSLEPKFRQELCVALDRPDLVKLAFSTDPEQKIEFKQQIAENIKNRNYEECRALFKDVDACVEPVLTLPEACEHEQLISRGMTVEVDGIKQIGCAIKMSESPPQFHFKGCAVGEHNASLATEFGFSEEQVEHFKEAGVFG
ncbi:MAG: CoA transferase [Emcibacter sp.]|nr:CoA transferase [Emcibacter sp.]